MMATGQKKMSISCGPMESGRLIAILKELKYCIHLVIETSKAIQITFCSIQIPVHSCYELSRLDLIVELEKFALVN